MRKSNLYLVSLGAGFLLLIVLLLIDTGGTGRQGLERTAAAREAARALRVTDLCLFTEARYTRHPSMADLHAPLQEHPLSFEHFPSGSFLRPVNTWEGPRGIDAQDGGEASP